MAKASPARALMHGGLAEWHGPWPEAWPLARCMALGPTRSLRVEKWRSAEAAPTAKKSKLHCPCATLPLGSCPEALTEKEHGAVRQVPKTAKDCDLTVPRAPSPSMRAICSPMPTQGLRLGRGPAREDGRRAEFGKNAVTEVHFLQNLPLCYR